MHSIFYYKGLEVFTPTEAMDIFKGVEDSSRIVTYRLSGDGDADMHRMSGAQRCPYQAALRTAFQGGRGHRQNCLRASVAAKVRLPLSEFVPSRWG